MDRSVIDDIEVGQPSPTSKKLNFIAIVALAMTAIGLGIYFNWAFANEDVLQIKTDPIPAKVIAYGDSDNGAVLLDVDFCKTSSTEGQLRTSFVSQSREIFLPIQPEKSGKGCNKAQFPVIIPEDLPSDTYQVRLRTTYNLNPLKQIVVEEYKSTPFKIVNKGL